MARSLLRLERIDQTNPNERGRGAWVHLSHFVHLIVSLWGGSAHADSFGTLGLNRHATLDEVRVAHRRLVKLLHPLADRGDRLATVRLAEINAARDAVARVIEARPGATAGFRALGPREWTARKIVIKAIGWVPERLNPAVAEFRTDRQLEALRRLAVILGPKVGNSVALCLLFETDAQLEALAREIDRRGTGVVGSLETILNEPCSHDLEVTRDVRDSHFLV